MFSSAVSEIESHHWVSDARRIIVRSTCTRMHGRDYVMDFQTALSRPLQFEGGFVRDPLGQGDTTNLGVTQATLTKGRGGPIGE
jgi:hypothetical protein